jgi:hypothetical protein
MNAAIGITIAMTLHDATGTTTQTKAGVDLGGLTITYA